MRGASIRAPAPSRISHHQIHHHHAGRHASGEAPRRREATDLDGKCDVEASHCSIILETMYGATTPWLCERPASAARAGHHRHIERPPHWRIGHITIPPYHSGAHMVYQAGRYA